ncbi:MAG: glycosyltransferase family 4 protein [Cyanobacteria bacterium P01_C01_bin.121]
MKHTFVFIEVFGCEGGIQSYIQDVLEGYGQVAAKRNHTADVFLLRDAECDHLLKDDPAFRYHYLKSDQPIIERLKLSSLLITHLIRERPDHVFCGHINLAALVGPLCRMLGIPYTVMTYGKEVWYPLSTVDKWALQNAHRVWTISRYSRELANEANQVTPDKFDMLPCVVNGRVFTPGPPPQTLIDKYQLKDARILTTVARLWPGDIYKGVDVTIRALPKISQTFPRVKYVVIGRGDDQPRLAQLAVNLGVADRVIFAGFVPDDALVDHYRLADVYVMPSKEGFGIVYLEAMTCEVPVIAGDDDGSADPLQDGLVGWQVPHRDPEAVAIACIEALSWKDPRCNGAWLREQTLLKFSSSALVSRIDELIASH